MDNVGCPRRPLLANPTARSMYEETTMIELKQKRRSFLLGLAGLGISHTLLQGPTAARAATPQGYVLGPDGGEHLVHFRNPGNIFIKVDPVKGSGNLAMGTQQIP